MSVALRAAEPQRRAAARTAFADYVRRSGLNAVVLGASKDPNAKVTTILVEPVTGRPVLAAKAPMTAAAEARVRAEAQLLLELEALDLDGARDAIPRVVDVVDFEGRAALVTTAVPGMPMTTSYSAWGHTRSPTRVLADFTAAAAWLAGLQSETAHERAPLDFGSGVTERLALRFPDDPELPSDLSTFAGILERLSAESTPRTVVHGDYWCGNLLLERGNVAGVVDWEGGAVSGEPVRDLVRFALAYALYLDRHARRGRRVRGHPGLVAGSWGAGVVYATAGRGWFPNLFRTFLKVGLERLGASPDCWRHAALAGLAETAATADDDIFARRNLVLFRSLSRLAVLR